MSENPDPTPEPNTDLFEFEIELTAKTIDEGGLAASFARQLSQFGGTATLLSQTSPYRVDSSGTFWFEARRLYKISL